MATAKTANLGSEFDQTGKPAGACVMVLFGASGDLAKRKLIPALFNLVKAKLLPQNFGILGVAIDDLSPEQFRNEVTGFLPAEDRGNEACQRFTERLSYQRGECSDPTTFSVVGTRSNE